MIYYAACHCTYSQASSILRCWHRELGSRPGLCPIVSAGAVLCFGSALPDSLVLHMSGVSTTAAAQSEIIGRAASPQRRRHCCRCRCRRLLWLRMRKLSVCLPACLTVCLSLSLCLPVSFCPSVCFAFEFWAHILWHVACGRQLSAGNYRQLVAFFI